MSERKITQGVLTVSTPPDAAPNYVVVCTCGQPCPMHGPAVAADPPGEREADALVDQIEDEVRRWPTSAQAIRQYVLPLLTKLRAALPAAAPAGGPSAYMHPACAACGHVWGLHVPTLQGTECHHEHHSQTTSGVIGLPVTTQCKCSGYSPAPVSGEATNG